MRLVPLALLVWLLALAAPAHADLFVEEGAFGSGARPAGFADARSVAVDDAGRVYVADAGAGRVELFDSASSSRPNRFLRSIGEGVLQRPVAVVIDNRQRLFVADAAKNAVFQFDSFVDNFRSRGSLAPAGTDPGQLDVPAGLTSDPTQRIYVVESGSLRVSTFRPTSGRRLVFQSAFGIAQEDPPLRAPAQIARDTGGRLYIANAGVGDGAFVRVVDKRGRDVADMGVREGVVTPSGVAVDRFNRVLIADTGSHKLRLYDRIQRGGRQLAVYDGALNPASSVRRPSALALAPGSLLYALVDGGRILRLRYDDVDRDGVSDAGDNCLGLANADQDDPDGDGQGNACDRDDDGDDVEDATDKCPTEEGDPDEKGDGCRDALSRILVPDQRRAYSTVPEALSGRSDGGQLGLSYVEVAVGRRLSPGRPDNPQARCGWYSVDQERFVRGRCANPRWFRARGRRIWDAPLPTRRFEPGGYVAVVRGAQPDGSLETDIRYGENMRIFDIRDDD